MANLVKGPQWNTEMDQVLIKHVEMTPRICLTNHFLYKDKSFKQLTWESIGKTLGGITGRTAEYRYEVLKTKYFEEKRKLAQGLVTVDNVWPLFCSMKFLCLEADRHASEEATVQKRTKAVVRPSRSSSSYHNTIILHDSGNEDNPNLAVVLEDKTVIVIDDSDDENECKVPHVTLTPQTNQNSTSNEPSNNFIDNNAHTTFTENPANVEVLFASSQTDQYEQPNSNSQENFGDECASLIQKVCNQINSPEEFIKEVYRMKRWFSDS